MDISLLGASLVPVALALTEVIKRLGVASKWSPVVSVVFGLGLVWIVFPEFNLLEGIVVGLGASGLWSGAKSVTK